MHRLAASVLALAVPLPAPPAAGPAAPGFVVRGARVFDGARLLPAQDVWVAGGKIAAIGRKLKVPSTATEIDGEGATLLPGLIDAHTHDWGDSPRQALRFGVTTELNMGLVTSYLAELRRAEAAGAAGDRASVLSAGNVVTPPKGHGTEYGVEVPTLPSAADAQAFVDARLAEGSDYVKIILEDGRACHSDFAVLGDAALSAAVAAAHRRGKLAIVHVLTEPAARKAIAAGADGIAHLFADAPPSPELVAQMRRRHAFAITTLIPVLATLGQPTGPALADDPRLAPFLSPGARTRLRAPDPLKCEGSASVALAAAQALHAAGVPLLAGTDSSVPGSWNGASLHGELALLVKAGLTPTEALAAATSAPARAFRLADRGRIARGLRADLLLVHGDPTRDITATRDIVGVWKAGVRVAREPGTSAGPMPWLPVWGPPPVGRGRPERAPEATRAR